MRNHTHTHLLNENKIHKKAFRQAGRTIMLNSLEQKQSYAELTKKTSLSRKPLSLTRLLSTTTQVNKTKKSNNYISKVHAKSKM